MSRRATASQPYKGRKRGACRSFSAASIWLAILPKGTVSPTFETYGVCSATPRAYPDTAAQVGLFLSAETQARAAETALWGNPAYRIQAAGEVSASARGFLIVEAKLGERSTQPDDIDTDLACRWSVLDGSLQIDVALTARAVCAWPSGQAVRLRGWVSGSRMDLNVAGHAEKLEDTAPSRLDQ